MKAVFEMCSRKNYELRSRAAWRHAEAL